MKNQEFDISVINCDNLVVGAEQRSEHEKQVRMLTAAIMHCLSNIIEGGCHAAVNKLQCYETPHSRTVPKLNGAQWKFHKAPDGKMSCECWYGKSCIYDSEKGKCEDWQDIHFVRQSLDMVLQMACTHFPGFPAFIATDLPVDKNLIRMGAEGYGS